MSGAIYKITCLPTGRFYVGSAIHAQKRWREHRHALRHAKHVNSKLQRAWNKYGESQFVFGILEPVLDPKLLISREQYYINALSACADGFNCRKKADSNLGMKYVMIKRRGSPTDETRAKMSKSASIRRMRERWKIQGAAKGKDITGLKYGRLTVQGLEHSDGKGTTFWSCRCDCGQMTVARRGLLTSGDKKSCGCLFRETRVREVSLETRKKISASLLGKKHRQKSARTCSYVW